MSAQPSIVFMDTCLEVLRTFDKFAEPQIFGIQTIYVTASFYVDRSVILRPSQHLRDPSTSYIPAT